MVQSHVILVSGWVLFCVWHSILASGRAKRLANRVTGTFYAYYRFGYNLFAGLFLLVLIVLSCRTATFPIWPASTITVTAGMTLAGIGLLVWISSAGNYFRSKSFLQSVFWEVKAKELIRKGILNRVRHPLYLGTLLLLWGCWIAFPAFSLLLINLVLTGYTFIGIRFEEQKLEKQFGAAYRIYRREVPMIIPGLKTGRGR
jgi:protein-S-isoprenylcysteine O-methyltransferase Ste14